MDSHRECKLIFTGPMGAGKTTAIAAISESPPVSTEVRNTDLASHSKATTTAAFDYGEVALPGGSRLRLYGTPGQERFDHMRSMIGEGALGVVVLLDNSAADPLGDLARFLDGFLRFAVAGRLVVGVGRTERHPSPSLEDYSSMLANARLTNPVVSVDVRQRGDVLLLLELLLHQIDHTAGGEAGNE